MCKIICELRENDRRCKDKYCPYDFDVMTMVEGSELKHWKECRRCLPTKNIVEVFGNVTTLQFPLYACCHVKGIEEAENE